MICLLELLDNEAGIPGMSRTEAFGLPELLHNEVGIPGMGLPWAANLPEVEPPMKCFALLYRLPVKRLTYKRTHVKILFVVDTS